MVLEEAELKNVLKSGIDYRPTYYINQDRIREFYDQCLGGIQGIASSESVSKQVSAEINIAIAKIGGSVSRGKANNAEWNLSHISMAILVEYYSEKMDQVLEISSGQTYDFSSKKLKYEGTGTITLQEERPSTNLTQIPEAVCEHIQEERLQRLAILRKDPQRDDVYLNVWTAPTKPFLVSFCDYKWMNYGTFSAFGMPEGKPTGILGLYGQSLKFGIYDLILIAPLWIWKVNT